MTERDPETEPDDFEEFGPDVEPDFEIDEDGLEVEEPDDDEDEPYTDDDDA